MYVRNRDSPRKQDRVPQVCDAIYHSPGRVVRHLVIGRGVDGYAVDLQMSEIEDSAG
jgi:hypothetical protein